MDSFEYGLPLNAIDKVNKPPPYFLHVQDGCVIVVGLGWTVAYVLYIRQGRKDKSYGMPIVALCANLAWEIMYGVFYPLSTAETTTLIGWIFIDFALWFTTLTYGPEEFSQAPLIAKNIPLVLVVGTGLMLFLHWAFIETCQNRGIASFYSAFACQVFLGLSSIAQIINRNSVRGHSLTIWFLRTVGSLAALFMFNWRYAHYPDDYTVVRTPMAIFMFVVATLGDLLYLVVFLTIRNSEQVKKKKKY